MLTNLDVHFGGVLYLALPTAITGLELQFATEEELVSSKTLGRKLEARDRNDVRLSSSQLEATRGGPRTLQRGGDGGGSVGYDTVR